MRSWAVSLWGALALCVAAGCARAPEAIHGGFPARETGTLQASLVGAWVRPIPGGQAGIEGIALDGDGSLGLLGIHTMHGLTWRVEGNTLIVATNTARYPEPQESRLGIAQVSQHTLILQADANYLSGTYKRSDGAAGVVSGTVTSAQRIALPPDAALHMELSDVTRVNVPARLIANQTIPTLGRQGPIPFRMFYATEDIDPNFTYVVRATIVAGGRPRFITENPPQVLTRGRSRRVEIEVVPLEERGAAAPAATAARRMPPAIEMPATFSGVLGCRQCAGARVTLTLRPDGVFFLRQASPGAAINPEEIRRDLGRWRLTDGGRTLILSGGTEALRRFEITADRSLHVLNNPEEAIDPHGRYDLVRIPEVDQFRDTFRLRGMFSSVAGTGLFIECVTGVRFPVAREGEHAALERASTGARPSPGAPLLITIDGRFARRPKVEGQGSSDVVVVDRLLEARPGERCAGAPVNAPLENTYWKLIELRGKTVQASPERREPHVRLLADGRRVEGHTGCSQFSGTYEIARNRLRIEDVVTMRRACRNGMDEERAFLRVLESAPTYEVSGEDLTLSDGGTVLARFESAYLR
jgi:uncharacterized lipoprotein YbaY/heat shock protein HslJ